MRVWAKLKFAFCPLSFYPLVAAASMPPFVCLLVYLFLVAFFHFFFKAIILLLINESLLPYSCRSPFANFLVSLPSKIQFTTTKNCSSIFHFHESYKIRSRKFEVVIKCTSPLIIIPPKKFHFGMMKAKEIWNIN